MVGDSNILCKPQEFNSQYKTNNGPFNEEPTLSHPELTSGWKKDVGE